MKNFLLLSFLLCFISILNAQEYLYLNQVFENSSTNLIKAIVIEKPGQTKHQLKNIFIEISSKIFNNLNNVITSESDDFVSICAIQPITLKQEIFLIGDVYIEQPQYTIIKAYFKNDKLKIELYNDGNSYMSGVHPRTYYIKDYFEEENVEIPSPDKYYKIRYTNYQRINAYLTASLKILNTYKNQFNKEEEKW